MRRATIGGLFHLFLISIAAEEVTFAKREQASKQSRVRGRLRKGSGAWCVFEEGRYRGPKGAQVPVQQKSPGRYRSPSASTSTIESIVKCLMLVPAASSARPQLRRFATSTAIYLCHVHSHAALSHQLERMLISQRIALAASRGAPNTPHPRASSCPTQRPPTGRCDWL